MTETTTFHFDGGPYRQCVTFKGVNGSVALQEALTKHRTFMSNYAPGPCGKN